MADVPLCAASVDMTILSVSAEICSVEARKSRTYSRNGDGPVTVSYSCAFVLLSTHVAHILSNSLVN